jgi:hypothetical protein
MKSKREQAAIDTGTVVKVGATAFRDFGAEDTSGNVKEIMLYSPSMQVKQLLILKTVRSMLHLNDEDVIAKLVGA